jgi:hypothetical protein
MAHQDLFRRKSNDDHKAQGGRRLTACHRCASRLIRRTGFASEALAWFASESRATGRYKEKAVDRFSTESMVLRKTPNGWRIIHIHWSSRNAQ